MEVVIYILIALAILSSITFYVITKNRLFIIHSIPQSSNTMSGMLYYYLPETIIKVKTEAVFEIEMNPLNAGATLKSQTFEISTEIVADTSELIQLRHHQNVLANDTVKYTIGSNGLLAGAANSMEDRTQVVITALFTAPQKVLDGKGIAGFTERESQTQLETVKATAEFLIRASELMSGKKQISWKPKLKTVSGFAVSADASFSVSNSNQTQPKTKLTVNIGQRNFGKMQGLYTRPTINEGFEIVSAVISQTKVIKLNVVDTSRLFLVPVKRTAFVKREQNMKFSNGLLTEHEIKNPSSLEGFIGIPVDIAKAIVSIPGQLLSFNINSAKQQKSLVTEKMNLEAEILKREKAKLDALKLTSELEAIRKELEKVRNQPS